MTTYEDYLADALDLVSAWELPPGQLADEAMYLAQSMADQGLEPSHPDLHEYPYPPLRF